MTSGRDQPPGPTLGESAHAVLAAHDPVSDECARLLALVNQRCPGLLPPAPLPSGTAGPAVTLGPDEVQRLVSVASSPAAGAGSQASTVVWTLGGSELLVIVAKVRVRLDEGTVLVTIPVECDQVPGADVDLWGDALTAYAWQIVLSVTAGIAGAAGQDVDRAPLVPAALTASANGLGVHTMARHTFDRDVGAAGRTGR
jgi:hypothetical protein